MTFGISKSFAPNALNPRLINFTRYALLANSRDLLIEKFSTDEQKKVHLAFSYFHSSYIEIFSYSNQIFD